jgi:hypothetical protein
MILAPTLTLSAGSGAAIARPTFSRDFAGEKTLNNGTGPSITFTRASIGTFFDANGVLQTAAANVPRFDHSGGNSLGLLIEEARTNSIRNSQAGGSTSGVIGSGGVMPTNGWSISANANGITSEIIGTGTEDGLAYIDIKVSGTPTSTSFMFIADESSSQVVAANGQVWTHSAYIKLQAGAATNAVTQINIAGRLSDGGVIAGQTNPVTFTPTSSALKTQRRTTTITFSDATVVRAAPLITVSYTNGNAIDLTLRIAAPQLEQGAFPTSYIPTTSAAVTRSADSAIVNPISSFYNASEGTLFAEATPKTESLHNGYQRVLLTANDNTDLNQITIGQGGSGNLDKLVFVSFINAGGGTAEMFGGSGIAGSTQKAAGAYKASDFAFSVNGGAVDTEASGSPASGITHLFIGRRPADGFVSGHIRRIAYFPKRLSNALLQSLTT